MHVYVRGGPACPGLAVPEEPHQLLSLSFQSGNMGRRNTFFAASKATGLHSGRFYTTTRLSAGECKGNLTTQVLVAPALPYELTCIWIKSKEPSWQLQD